MHKSLTNYYRIQQTAFQWIDFLRALADELSSQGSEDELRLMFAAVGKRQASLLQNFLGDARTLDRLEEGLNDYWSRQHWGFVRFHEHQDHVGIHHAACPLGDAFGEESLNWSVGFLEGFYEEVFNLMGAGRGMQVHLVDVEDAGLGLFFRFGKARIDD